jgi:hypothetical protein
MDNMTRYLRAAHCVQAGSKVVAQRTGEHSQSRTGINVAMTEHGSLAGLLMSKGVITEDEYYKALADGMEREVRRLEEELSAGGAKITLVGAMGGIDQARADDPKVS